MRTPSIGWRFVVAGVGVVAVLVLALDLLLFLSVGAAGDESRTRLLVLEAIITPLVLALAALLLRWIAEIATKPLDEIAARARLTTLGLAGERLQPDRPETRLGQMATAYDEMLDSLEGAVSMARAATAESERLERRTRTILETAREAFLVVDEGGDIIDWNPEAERMFGWSRREILGRSWKATLLSDEVRDQLEIDRRDAGGLVWPYGDTTVVLEAVRRDGGSLPIGMTVWATTHEGVRTFNGFVRDLTEHRQAEDASAHLAAIVESSDQAMLSTDPEGTILTWNPAAERMYGYTAAEAVGQRLADLIVPDVALGRFEQALSAVAEGASVKRKDEVRRRKDGSLLHVSVAVAPLLDATGAIYGACSVARDRTEERRLASHLDATLAALARAADEARASEAQTRRFLDDAAHQLRSPISNIRACAETLSRVVTPAQHERLLDAMCRESERAGRLMAGLLRLARLGHEEALARQPTDVSALCERGAERARLDGSHLQITVTTVGAPGGRAHLAADAVGEILSNLLDNAVRHARSRIDISTRAGVGAVELRVVNDGPGIPDDQAEQLFQRFVSFDAKGGSGLGLAIGRELARAHGGDLTYESGVFVLRLACQIDPLDAGDAVEEALSRFGSWSVEPARGA